MILGKFYGVLDSNKNTIYIAVANCSKDEAITLANRVFKVKKETLKVQRAYIANNDSDEFSYRPFKGSKSIYVVSKAA